MNRTILALIAILAAPAALFAAAGDKFVDCGEGYVLASSGARDGIQTKECKKLWCRDLENNKSMGRENTAAAGYVATSSPSDICDSQSNCVSCFGKRKWCADGGSFDVDKGIYVKSGSSVYRGVLSGNCYKWQLQNHTCGPNEVAINDGDSWVCLNQSSGSDGARAAIKARAVRRTSTGPIIKKK
ncbi:MAG: hypothetical protein LBL21_02905 [Rickettsiales bacterium]|jgi:hypothetical protein|nr:hypothetical protein [Rickettsiales bacterium]